MNNQPIGVLDSGVGGLSIWKEIVRELPIESTIYLADSLNCPYGDRTEEEIYALAKRLVKFLLDNRVKIIVLACNTITVFCVDRLRLDFPNVPIVGTVPVIKTATEHSKNKKIGILSTVSTAKSSYQKSLIEKFAKDCRVFNIGTNKLVPFIERGGIDSFLLQNILRTELQPFIDNDIDVLALGCSHFPFLKEHMQKILGRSVSVLDSGAAIARQVRRVLTNNKSLSPSSSSFYAFCTTGNAEEFTKVSKKLLGENLVNKVKIIQRISL